MIAGEATAQYSAPPDNTRPWALAQLTKYTMAGGLSSEFGFWPSCGSGSTPLAAARAWAPEEQAVWNRYWQLIGERLGSGWSFRITSLEPQNCTPLIRAPNPEALEVGLSGCPDNYRRVGFTSPYDYRNNPTNYTFRSVGAGGVYLYPSCTALKASEGFNPWAGGAWSTTETIYPSYNLFVQCPEGYFSHPAWFVGTTPWCLPLAGDGAPDPLRNAGSAPPDAGEPKTCNPISVGTGNKYLRESDYVSPAADSLSWERHYNHLTVFAGNVLAPRWTHSYSRWIATIGSDRAWIHRPDGRMFSARLVDTSISGNRQRWTMELNARGQLWRSFDANSQPNGWVLYAPDDATFEVYKVNGQLDRVIRTDGSTHQLSYSDGTGGAGGGYVLDDQGAPTTSVLPAGLLIRVTSSLGRAISIGYNSALRATFITLPTGARLRYTFDAAFNVTSITNLDGTAKQYVYGEAANVSSVAMPSALTGIIDENNRRFATYRYDHLGRAISARHWADSQQTVSVNAVTLGYTTAGDGSPTSTTVTDALGTTRTYSFFNLSGLIKQTGQSQPAGSGCAPSAAAMLYDSGGNVSSRTNFNGTKTCYAFDASRNLETKRVEGLDEQCGVLHRVVFTTHRLSHHQHAMASRLAARDQDCRAEEAHHHHLQRARCHLCAEHRPGRRQATRRDLHPHRTSHHR